MKKWTENLPERLQSWPAALGFPDASATTDATRARYQAAQAMIAVLDGVAFDLVTSGRRPGLQDFDGVRIDLPKGRPGVRLALAGMVATHMRGDLAADPIAFTWAASQADATAREELEAESVTPEGVLAALRSEVDALARELQRHGTTIDALASRLESGDRVTAEDIRQVIAASKATN